MQSYFSRIQDQKFETGNQYKRSSLTQISKIYFCQHLANSEMYSVFHLLCMGKTNSPLPVLVYRGHSTSLIYSTLVVSVSCLQNNSKSSPGNRLTLLFLRQHRLKDTQTNKNPDKTHGLFTLPASATTNGHFSSFITHVRNTWPFATFRK